MNTNKQQAAGETATEQSANMDKAINVMKANKLPFVTIWKSISADRAYLNKYNFSFNFDEKPEGYASEEYGITRTVVQVITNDDGDTNKTETTATPKTNAMNTYHKFVPNVWLAKCTEKHEKGSVIPVANKYGKENPSIVHNLIGERDGFFYYSIVRADGFNYAEKRAEKLESYAENAEKKSTAYYEASNEGREFLALGEPIKVGHHSEKRHRALIERNWNRMGKSVEYGKKSEEYKSRAEYWKSRAQSVNLSTPDSLEYYEYALEQAKAKHEGLKSGRIPKDHSFSLPYAKKEVNEIEKKLALAKKLWA
jgi:hypothetical protein